MGQPSFSIILPMVRRDGFCFCKGQDCTHLTTNSHHPDPTAHISLANDASDTQIGGVLQQLHLGSWAPPMRYWIEGKGDRGSVHFAVTFLDCWRTSFCATTIIKIVNNNTNDDQTSGISGVFIKP